VIFRGVLGGAILVAGCPIPWRDTMVVQPALEVDVKDESGAMIEGARVLVVAGSNPHHQLQGTEEQTTDAWGHASFEERSETKTVYPLMMHGVPFYYFEWCVEAEGFVAQRGELGGEPVDPVLEVALAKGGDERHCTTDGGRAEIRAERVEGDPKDGEAKADGAPAGQ
jgi:hypothetical protein